MKSYKQKFKLKLLTAMNCYREELLLEETDEFESEISRAVVKYLSDTELMAFFFLFACTSSYEEISDKICYIFDKTYSPDTIKKYGARAIDRMVSDCHRNIRFKAWMKRQREN